MQHIFNIYKTAIIILAFLAFLIPGKFFLWTELHQSFLALTSVFLLCFHILSYKKIKIDFYFLFVNFLVILIWIWLIINELPFLSYAVIGSLYLYFSFFAYTLGKNCELRLLLEVSSFILIIVCAASVVIQIYQFNSWHENYQTLINHYSFKDGTRPYANIAQPNRLASIYVFSLAILLWASNEGILKIKYLYIFTFFIAIGITLTYSRTAYLCILLMSLFSLLQRRKYQRIYFLFLLLVCLFASKVINNFYINPRELTENLNGGRFALWKMSFDAISESPWIGYGFNETGRAHFGVIEESQFKHVFAAQAHNIFLDFILWFGVPLGSALIFICIYFFYKLLISLIKTRNFLPLISLIPFSIHSLLEYPLYYANALMFFSIFIGVATNHISTEKNSGVFYIRKKYFSALFLISSFFGGYVFYECTKMEEGLLNQKMYFSRIKGIEKTKTEEILFLDIPSAYINSIGIRTSDKPKIKDIDNIENLLHYLVVPRHYWVLLEYYKEHNNQQKFDFWLSKGKSLLPQQQSLELQEHYAPKSE